MEGSAKKRVSTRRNVLVGLSGRNGGCDVSGRGLQSSGGGEWTQSVAHDGIFWEQLTVLMDDGAGAPGLSIVQILSG